jgi:hypothetical protein
MVDDVKVRFSAEGEAAIIKAFADIGKSAKTGASEAKGAIGELREELAGLGKELIGFVALAAVVEKMHELGKEVIDTGADFYKLEQTTGLSAKTLNALSDAAEHNNVSMETVSKTATILTRNIGQAEQGSKKAAQGFSELGIKVADLKNLSPDQQFTLINTKLQEVDSAARRTAIGAQLMGRGFAEAEPALRALAEEGVDALVARMKQLGVYIDQDTIEALHRAKQASADLTDELKGLATQFIAGLAPAAASAMRSLNQATTGDGVSGLRTLGEWAGRTAEAIVLAFTIVGKTIGAFIALTQNSIQAIQNVGSAARFSLVNAAPNWLRGADMKDGAPGFNALKQRAQGLTANNAASQSIYDGLKKDIGDAVDNFRNPKPLPEPEKKDDGPDPSVDGQTQNTAAIGKARLALIQAQLEAENALYNAQAGLRLSQDKADYESGKLSLAAYFADRAQIITQQGANEIKILEARRAAAAALPTDINDPAAAIEKQVEVAKLDGDIAAKRIQVQGQLADLERERGQEQERQAKAQESAENKLLVIEGKRADAARNALASDLKALEAELKKGGIAPADIASALDTARTQGNNKINFDETKTNADANLSSLATATRGVNDQEAGGQLFPAQAQEQIRQLQTQALPTLQAMATSMTALAEATKTPGNPLGDPQMIAEAQQFTQSVKAIGTAVDVTGQQMAQLKKTGQDAFQNGIATFLDDIGNKTESVKDRFRDLALSVVQSLQRIAAQLLSQSLTNWLFGGPAGGAGGIGGTSPGASGNLSGPGAAGSPGGAGSNLGGSLTNGLIGQGISGLFNNSSVQGFFGQLFGGGYGSAGAFADGGHITGPGTSRSDSIPIMASTGEFMVNAAAVNKPGVLPLLHAINGAPQNGVNNGVGKYASGGMVSGGVQARAHSTIINVLDPSLLGDHLATPGGRDSMINVMSNDSGKFKGALNL